jgi:hypothetical protein
MAKPITLSFHDNGVVEWTRTPHFTPFNGEGEMQRVTDIGKKPDEAKYFITWKLGIFAGHEHCYGMAARFDNGSDVGYSLSGNHDDTVLFNSYEEAVSHEIDMLNAMRKAGETFHG